MDVYKINCRYCQHFFVTWEPKNPYGCRYMGFKGKFMPSMEVFRSSGMPCQKYKPKRPGGR
ncbi:uracil-DNA glycosylase [Deltaproteobacteria bacterium Smac51]|nr:uracil-DNA glycosylase [Deltaproteobacteria bacterium Smac51]